MRRVDKDLPREMAAIHKAVAEPIAAGARSRVRSRSGRLAASVRAQGTQRVARVAAGRKSVPYAGPNHYGWPGRFAGNPFMTDALAAGKAEAIRTYNEMTERFLTRVWDSIN